MFQQNLQLPYTHWPENENPHFRYFELNFAHYICLTTLLLAHVEVNNSLVTLICIKKLKVNAKWFRYRSFLAQTLGVDLALLLSDRSTRRGEWDAGRRGRTWLLRNTRYPFYKRLCGPQGPSRLAEILFFTGIFFCKALSL